MKLKKINLVKITNLIVVLILVHASTIAWASFYNDSRSCLREITEDLRQQEKKQVKAQEMLPGAENEKSQLLTTKENKDLELQNLEFKLKQSKYFLSTQIKDYKLLANNASSTESMFDTAVELRDMLNWLASQLMNSEPLTFADFFKTIIDEKTLDQNTIQIIKMYEYLVAIDNRRTDNQNRFLSDFINLDPGQILIEKLEDEIKLIVSEIRKSDDLIIKREEEVDEYGKAILAKKNEVNESVKKISAINEKIKSFENTIKATKKAIGSRFEKERYCYQDAGELIP